MPHAVGLEQRVELARPVGRPVVGHHALHDDPEALVGRGRQPLSAIGSPHRAREPLVGGLAAHAGHRGGVRNAHAVAHALAERRPTPRSTLR